MWIKLFIIVTITGVLHNGVTSNGSSPAICILPPFPPHGRYEVPDVPDAKPGQSAKYYLLNMRCDEGYGVMRADGPVEGFEEVFCVNGRWSRDMPQCVTFCKLQPELTVNHLCYKNDTKIYRSCGKYVAPGFKVKPMCKSEHFSIAPLQPMICVNGTFDYIAKCQPECGRPIFTQHEHKEDISPPNSEGKVALRGEVPWHVVIYLRQMLQCGGSIISNRAVVTAGSCLTFFNSPLSDYSVAANKLYHDLNDARDFDVQMSKIKHVKNFGTDSAIITLVTPFVYNLYVRPVCLDLNSNALKQDLSDNNKGKVTGFGTTDNKNAERQETVELININRENCEKSIYPIQNSFYTKDILCTGYDKAFEVNFGLFSFKGGGLVFPHLDAGITRYYLAGIHLFGMECVKKKCFNNFIAYTMFANLSISSDEIKQFL